MSKAELISTINSIEKPDILDSIGLFFHQISTQGFGKLVKE